MRFVLPVALALLPAAAFAQSAGTSASQATMTASVTPPSGPGRASAAGASVSPTPARRHDVLKTSLVSEQMDESIAEAGTLTYMLTGYDSPATFTPPVLVHTVGRTLPVAAAETGDAKVVVAFTVDVQGRPCDVRVLHSNGAAVDKGTVDAVRQYRFRPATYERNPAVAHLTMEIALQQ